MKNRQKDEITMDILSVCNGGAPITRIMFHAYITHGQTKSYLRTLIEAGLVQYDALSRFYHATPKGLEYLRAISSMSDMLSITTRRSATEKIAASYL